MGGILALPVFQLSGHMFGDAATQQSQEKEDGHGQRNPEQDVVLRRWRYDLCSEVREPFSWCHLGNHILELIKRI